MSSNGTKVESSIPNWVVYALLGAVTFLIVNSIHTALLTLLVSGGLMLFIWSYLSKPIAEIQPMKEETIFDKNKINRSTFNKVTETNPQRKRYLRTIDDIDNAA
tara:strand:+ start:203 stop:514 length:312 start_codon:yes stop_codon:yes gene_type:complete